MNKTFLKRLLVLSAIYAVGYVILHSMTDGMLNAIEKIISYPKERFTMVIFPLCLMLGVFYVFSSLVKRWLSLLLLSLVLGGAGPLLLHILIQNAKNEPMAPMAYAAVILVYCIFSSFFFMLGSIVACLRRALRGRASGRSH